MSERIEQLYSVESWKQVLEESKRHPVLVFKHSNACPMSDRALRELQAYLEDADPRVAYHLVIVQNARVVSKAIEAHLDLQHETPQAIIVKDGREVWNASHSAITSSSLAEAVRRSAP